MFARRPQWQTNSEQISWDCTGGTFVNGVLKYIAHFLSCQSKAQKLEKYKIKIIWCVNRYQFKQWVLLIIKYTKTVKMSKRTYGMIISGEFFLSPNTIAKFICLDLPFRFPHSHFIDRILIYLVTVRLSKFLIPANDIQKSILINLNYWCVTNTFEIVDSETRGTSRSCFCSVRSKFNKQEQVVL